MDVEQLSGAHHAVKAVDPIAAVKQVVHIIPGQGVEQHQIVRAILIIIAVHGSGLFAKAPARLGHGHHGREPGAHAAPKPAFARIRGGEYTFNGHRLALAAIR